MKSRQKNNFVCGFGAKIKSLNYCMYLIQNSHKIFVLDFFNETVKYILRCLQDLECPDCPKWPKNKNLYWKNVLRHICSLFCVFHCGKLARLYGIFCVKLGLLPYERICLIHKFVFQTSYKTEKDKKSIPSSNIIDNPLMFPPPWE